MKFKQKFIDLLLVEDDTVASKEEQAKKSKRYLLLNTLKKTKYSIFCVPLR